MMMMSTRKTSTEMNEESNPTGPLQVFINQKYN